jgi:hypothetical protein
VEAAAKAAAEAVRRKAENQNCILRQAVVSWW